MRNLVDTLITEYRAEDHTTRVLERIAHANERLHSTITRLMGAFAALNFAQRAITFGGNAQQAASEYISLEARLKALVGTYEDARRKLGMAELVAAPSPFTTKQLSDAAVTLEAFGLNSERLLPILGKLGAAMGATDEKLEVFTRGFGKLGQGEMIDSDVLSAMGITKADFSAQGIEFDGSGKLQSSALESLQALERIINNRFGKIFDEMASTPEAKRASLEDAGQKIMRAIGMGMLRANAPAMDALTKTLSALANSGIVDKVAGNLANAFLSVFGQDTSDGMMRLTASFFAALDMVPDAATRAFRYVSDTFAAVWSNLKLLAQWGLDAISNLFNNGSITATEKQIQGSESANKKAKTIRAGMDFIGRGEDGSYEWGDSAKKISAIINGFVGLKSGDEVRKEVFGDMFDKRWMGFLNGLAKPLPNMTSLPDASKYGFDTVKTGFGSKAEEFYRMLVSASKSPTGIPDTTGQSFFTRKPASEEEDKLGEIVRNTEATARNTEKFDVGRLLFGGGDRAALGISMADLGISGGAMGRGGRTGFGGYGLHSTPQTRGLNLGRAATAAESFVQEMFKEALPAALQELGLWGAM